MKKRILNYECIYRQSLMLKCGLVVLIASCALGTDSALANVRIGSSGTSRDLDKYSTFDNYKIPVGKLFVDIVGIGVAGSNDHVYVWYKDGTVSSGFSKDFTRYQQPHRFQSPPGKTPKDIVAMAISGSDDKTYTWYKNQTRSVGTSTDLDKYEPPKPFKLPPGKKVSDIVGMATAGSNDHVYSWFKGGKVYSGSSLDLDRHSGPKSFTLRSNASINDVIDMGITGSNNHTYAWYRNFGQGLGAKNLIDEIDAAVHAFMKKNHIPGMTVALSKNGKGILGRGYGYANTSENKSMTKNHRSPIGSNSKIFSALAWMKISETKTNYSEKTKLYGSDGMLNKPQYLDFAKQSGANIQWYHSLKVAHLLTHTSGFNGSGDVERAKQMFNVTDDNLTYEQIHLHFLKTKPLASKPGKKWAYSNHGMGLMGMLIKTASRKSYVKYVADNILKPAGVSNPNTGIVPFRTHVNQFDSDGHSYRL